MNKQLTSILVGLSLLLPMFAFASYDYNPEPTHVDGKVENILKTNPTPKPTPKSSVKPKVKNTHKPAVKVKPKTTTKPRPQTKKFPNRLLKSK